MAAPDPDTLGGSGESRGNGRTVPPCPNFAGASGLVLISPLGKRALPLLYVRKGGQEELDHLQVTHREEGKLDSHYWEMLV